MLRDATYPFSGGVDVVSPALGVPPSRLISGMNYEPLAEGYGRIEGYERFDGRTAPSATNFWTLDFENGVQSIIAGNTVTGAASGATARVLIEPVDFTGSWALGTAAGTLVLANVSGTFLDNEILRVGPTACAFANGVAVEDSADTEDRRIAWRREAQEWRRALVNKPAGAGPIRGVAELNGSIYAWRDTVDGTACLMHRATASGWQVVDLPHRLAFTAGLLEIEPGDTITGGSSLAVATVVRVFRQTGDWGSTAAGYLVVRMISGTFTAGEALRNDATATMATGGAVAAIAIPPGGRFHTFNHNFYGSASTYRMYGANGVGRAFEFDGTNYVPIETGTPEALDKPVRCFEIAQHMGLCFAGGSVQLSAPGEPSKWAVIDGASEFGFGSDITDVVQAAETAVALFGTQRIGMLTGTDSDSFQLQELTEEAGADAWTAQRIGTTVYLDRRGLRSLSASQAYGNFRTGTLSMLIEPYFRAKRRSGAVPIASLVCRSKSQYRLMWSDGTGLTVYMGDKTPSSIPFTFDNGMIPACAMTCEMSDGTEGMFVGATNGFVYRLDSGTSMDGVGVKGFVMTPFNHLGAPRVEKRIHSASIEMQAPPRASIGLTAQFNYGDGDRPIAGSQDFTVIGAGAGIEFLVQGGGGAWDQATWNQFYWSSPIEGVANADVDGIGRNVSLIIACDCASTEAAHVLQAYIINYSARRKVIGA